MISTTIMIKRFFRRHRLTGLVFVPLLALLVLPIHYIVSTSTHSLPPTQVIVESAIVIDQGVRVTWLPSQVGAYPIAAYIIESAPSGQGFTKIGQVEAGSTNYIDSNGHSGDLYRVVAVDNHQPATLSLPSESVAARLAHPGEVVVTTKQLPVINQANSFAEATTLLDEAFQTLDENIAAKDSEALIKTLGTIQLLQHQLLSMATQASPSEKQQAVKVCQIRDDLIHASIALIPETSRIEGTLVEAGCLAIDRAL